MLITGSITSLMHFKAQLLLITGNGNKFVDWDRRHRRPGRAVSANG